MVKGIEYITGWRGTIEPIALVSSTVRGDYKAAIDPFNMDEDVAELLKDSPHPVQCPVCGSHPYILGFIEGYGNLLRCPSVACFPQVPRAFSNLLSINLERLRAKNITVDPVVMYEIASYIHSRTGRDLVGILTITDWDMKSSGVVGKYPRQIEAFKVCVDSLTVETPMELLQVFSFESLGEGQFPIEMFSPSERPHSAAVDILNSRNHSNAGVIVGLLNHPANRDFSEKMEALKKRM